MDELPYWLALLRAPGVGTRTYLRLLDAFAGPKAFFDAGAAAWSTRELSAKTQAYLAHPDWETVAQDLEWARGEHCHILSLKDPRYPALLREMVDPPPVLFVHGDPQVLGMPQLAIVGSRNPSPSGQQTAYEFAKDLAGRGLTITSGLAIGIDGAGHRGALDAGGFSVAVGGTGLDRVYPSRHRELAHEIARRGALVSEFPLGTAPRAQNFPRRNRIISGLSLGTLVVEAAVRSGSLITARCAADQGREVFAIPGSIHNPLARGCHALIREGAKLAETAEHVLEELGSLVRVVREAQDVAAQGVEPKSENTQGELDLPCREFLKFVGFEPTGVDVLVARSGLTAEAVSSMLLILELREYVVSVAGGCYCRTSKV